MGIAYTATYSITLRHAATRCNTSTHCNTLQNAATLCSILQFILFWFRCVFIYTTAKERERESVAACEYMNAACYAYRGVVSYIWHCITLHHTATLQHIAFLVLPSLLIGIVYTATRCKTLQHAAKRCNTLQHTAIHCKTLFLLFGGVCIYTTAKESEREIGAACKFKRNCASTSLLNVLMCRVLRVRLFFDDVRIRGGLCMSHNEMSHVSYTNGVSRIRMRRACYMYDW